MSKGGVSKKAKYTTLMWALKYRGTDMLACSAIGKGPRLYPTRKTARNYRGPRQSIVRIRVVVEEL